jgi:(p)ppGpp synthase/HD superfamily hydrolase
MSTNPIPPLQRAQALAATMHLGQEYNGQNFYDAHVRGVAHLTSMATGNDEDAVIVAFLHDIVEDTPMTLGGLRAWFSDDVVTAVGYLTRTRDQPYHDYITTLTQQKGRAARLARIVKHADLTFNRLHCLGDRNYRGLVQRYTEGLKRLQPHILADFKDAEQQLELAL